MSDLDQRIEEYINDKVEYYGEFTLKYTCDFYGYFGFNDILEQKKRIQDLEALLKEVCLLLKGVSCQATQKSFDIVDNYLSRPEIKKLMEEEN